MSNFKNYLTILCTLFTLLFTTVVATPHQNSDSNCKKDILKKYVTTDSVVFCDGKMFVVENNTAIQVDSLHQDDDGVFMVVALYGRCPYGHPYSRDGGCYGIDCPFSY